MKMSEKHTIGEWSDSINAFWYGANDCEWVAWKGSHQIFVYPSEDYPRPPTQIVQHNKRIETVEDFTEAMETGVLFEATFKEGKAYWQDADQNINTLEEIK